MDKLKIHTAERRSIDPNLSPPLWGAKILCKFLFKTQVLNRSVCAGSQRWRSVGRMPVLLWQILEQCAIWRFFIQNKEMYTKAYGNTIWPSVHTVNGFQHSLWVTDAEDEGTLEFISRLLIISNTLLALYMWWLYNAVLHRMRNETLGNTGTTHTVHKQGLRWMKPTVCDMLGDTVCHAYAVFVG